MVSSPLVTAKPLAHRTFTPFASFDAPSSALSSRSSSWAVQDEIFRKFAEPASKKEREETDKDIKCA